MAHVQVEAPDLSLDSPTLVEGLPGTGLIAKLVGDHLVSEFEMTYYAGVYCEGVPPVAAYRTNDAAVRPAVQLYAAPDHDLLVLVSDVPVSPSDAPGFADCLTDWFDEHDVTPVYVTALDAAADGSSGAGGTSGEGADAGGRSLLGLSVGAGADRLERAGVDLPTHPGIVRGATGSLLNAAAEARLDCVGLLVETDGEVPDIDAALAVIEGGVEPLVGVDVDTEPFEDRSIEMSEYAESVLQQILGTDDGSSSAEPLPSFH